MEMCQKDLQKYFEDRFGDIHQHTCTPVLFAVESETPSTASSQEEDFFPTTIETCNSACHTTDRGSVSLQAHSPRLLYDKGLIKSGEGKQCSHLQL